MWTGAVIAIADATRAEPTTSKRIFMSREAAECVYPRPSGDAQIELARGGAVTADLVSSLFDTLANALSLDDRVLHRPERGGGPCRDVDLAVDVLDVVIGGLGRDVEPIGDLARGESLGRESQHVDLA
jgi:hypothetical protein